MNEAQPPPFAPPSAGAARARRRWPWALVVGVVVVGAGVVGGLVLSGDGDDGGENGDDVRVRHARLGALTVPVHDRWDLDEDADRVEMSEASSGARVTMSRLEPGGDTAPFFAAAATVLESDIEVDSVSGPEEVEVDGVAAAWVETREGDLVRRSLFLAVGDGYTIEMVTPVGEFDERGWEDLLTGIRVDADERPTTSSPVTATTSTPTTTTTTASVRDLPRQGDGLFSVASGPRSLWTTDFEQGLLTRRDSEGAVIEDISVGNGPARAAVAEDAVWVAHETDSAVWRVDLIDPSIVNQLPVAPSPVGLAVASTPIASVWTTHPATDEVSFFRVGTEPGFETVTVGDEPRGIAADPDGVWIANRGDGTVSRVDPETFEVAATVSVGSGPMGVALAGGSVWVTNQDGGTVTRIDAATNEVVDTVDVGAGPLGIAVGGGAVWVGNAGDEAVTRLSASTGEILDTIEIDYPPASLAVAEGFVWVTSAVDDSFGRIPLD